MSTASGAESIAAFQTRTTNDSGGSHFDNCVWIKITACVPLEHWIIISNSLQATVGNHNFWGNVIHKHINLGLNINIWMYRFLFFFTSFFLSSIIFHSSRQPQKPANVRAWTMFVCYDNSCFLEQELLRFPKNCYRAFHKRCIWELRTSTFPSIRLSIEFILLSLSHILLFGPTRSPCFETLQEWRRVRLFLSRSKSHSHSQRKRC